MEEIIEIELNENSILDLPKNLFYSNIDDCLLVISQANANWIGLFSKEQENIFELLYNKHTLSEVYKLSNNKEDFNFVVSQIMDRNFSKGQTITFNTPREEGLYIYLTNDCNLACTHCYMHSGKPKINELSKEEWFGVIKNAKENGIKSITFTGGEILQYKDWFEVIKYTKENNITTTLLTNGILWNQELIEKSKKYIDEVQISLDGTNENQNSLIRGKENFSKALENIKLFVKNEVKTVVATTPTLDNIKNIEKTYVDFATNLLNELQSENLYFKISQKLITGRKVYQLIKKQAKEYSDITRNLANTLYPNSDIRNFINNMQVGTGLKNCGYGGLSIASDGKFFLCNRVENLEAVGTNNDNFNEIMKKSLYYYEWSSVDNVMPCKNCELKYICGGGCRIDEYHFRGQQSKITKQQSLMKIDCTQDYKNSILKKMLGAIKYTYQVE